MLAVPFSARLLGSYGLTVAMPSPLRLVSMRRHQLSELT